jgi:hypothetical protein
MRVVGFAHARTHGEPVVSMSLSFRKPYEILLLARKPSVQNTLEIPKNKVLIAVPGYHSQKPCLKGISPEIVLTSGIFDGIFPEGSRICELYARNLVEEWMSVGDECLKFMRDNYWKQKSNDFDTIIAIYGRNISVAFAGTETNMSVPESNMTTAPPAYKFL